MNAAATANRRFADAMEWVLDWNRILNLFVALLPYCGGFGAAFAWIVARADKRAAQREQDAKADAAAIEQKRADAEEDRDRRRAEEADEMRRDRAAFFDDILAEARRSAENAQKMRQLYEQEVDRGFAMRTALAEAAIRESTLQSTINDLTRKVDQLQDVVADLRAELSKVQSKEAA